MNVLQRVGANADGMNTQEGMVFVIILSALADPNSSVANVLRVAHQDLCVAPVSRVQTHAEGCAPPGWGCVAPIIQRAIHAMILKYSSRCLGQGWPALPPKCARTRAPAPVHSPTTPVASAGQATSRGKL